LAQEVGRGVSAEEDRRLAALAEENERLKRAVKEVSSSSFLVISGLPVIFFILILSPPRR
jgi:hypothetical protein